MKYPDEAPPYVSLMVGSFCATFIAKIEYTQGSRFWWFTLAVVAFLWVWVGITVYLKSKQK